MNLIQLAEIVIGSIVSLGVLIAGTGYGYAQFQQGGKKLATDDIQLFNDQLDALRKIIDDQKDQINTMQNKHSNEIKTLQDDNKRHSQEIGRLQGINEEREKKIAELTGLLQNRDPALQEYMTFAREAITNFQNEMYELMPVIREIHMMIKNPSINIKQ